MGIDTGFRQEDSVVREGLEWLSTMILLTDEIIGEVALTGAQSLPASRSFSFTLSSRHDSAPCIFISNSQSDIEGIHQG